MLCLHSFKEKDKFQLHIVNNFLNQKLKDGN